MRTLLTLFLAGALGAGIVTGLAPSVSFGPTAAWADDDQRPALSPPPGEGGPVPGWRGDGPPPREGNDGPPPREASDGPPPGEEGPDQPGWRPRWLLGRDYEDHDKARAAVQAGEVKPLREVLEIVEAQFTGQMLEAELERKHGRWLYEIKVLAPDGSIMKLYYDASALDLVRAKGHGLDQWYCGDPDKRPAALDRVHRGGPHHDDAHHDDDKTSQDKSNGYLSDDHHDDDHHDTDRQDDSDHHSWW